MAAFVHRAPTFQIISLKQTLEMRLQGRRQDSFKATVAYHQVPFQKGYTSLQFHQHIITAAVPVFLGGRQVLLWNRQCVCPGAWLCARLCACAGVLRGRVTPCPTCLALGRNPREPRTRMSAACSPPPPPLVRTLSQLLITLVQTSAGHHHLLLQLSAPPPRAGPLAPPTRAPIPSDMETTEVPAGGRAARGLLYVYTVGYHSAFRKRRSCHMTARVGLEGTVLCDRKTGTV